MVVYVKTIWIMYYNVSSNFGNTEYCIDGDDDSHEWIGNIIVTIVIIYILLL